MDCETFDSEEFCELLKKDVQYYCENQKENCASVLIFPPVNSYRRFLTHKTAQSISPEISTFSIGCKYNRRTVVCFKRHLIKDLPDQTEISSSVPFYSAASFDKIAPAAESRRSCLNGGAAELYRPPAARGLVALKTTVPETNPAVRLDDHNHDTSRPGQTDGTDAVRRQISKRSPPVQKTAVRQRERRPDREVYVPRARRTNSSVQVAETAESPTKTRHVQYEPSQTNPVNLSELLLNEVNSSDKINYSNKNKSIVNNTTANETMADNIYNIETNSSGDGWSGKLTEGDGDLLELQRASEEINRSNRRIMKQSFRSDVLIISDNKRNVEKTERKEVAPEKKDSTQITADDSSITNSSPKNGSSVETHKANLDEDDWDSLYDENGDCLDSKLMEELTEFVGKVTIAKPASDYKPYQTKQKSPTNLKFLDDSFAHVLEIYDFPAEFKTQDLLSVFSPYKSTGFEIKWVDDTHALAVFSSVQVAQEALNQNLPFVKTRLLRDGTAESRLKARRCSEFLQPYRTRPETCPALARRLVSGALGVRLKTAAADRERERLLLKEAKERKLLATRQRDEAWEQDYTTVTDK